MNPIEEFMKDVNKTPTLTKEERVLIDYSSVFVGGFRPKMVECHWKNRDELVIETVWKKGTPKKVITFQQKMEVIRASHMKTKPVYPYHDMECPACNPSSTLTWEQYRHKNQVWAGPNALKHRTYTKEPEQFVFV